MKGRKANKINDFIWIELYKYDIKSYCDRYNNSLCKKLNKNKIICFSKLEYFSVKNEDNSFKCTLYVLKKDYTKGLEILKAEEKVKIRI